MVVPTLRAFLHHPYVASGTPWVRVHSVLQCLRAFCIAIYFAHRGKIHRILVLLHTSDPCAVNTILLCSSPSDRVIRYSCLQCTAFEYFSNPDHHVWLHLTWHFVVDSSIRLSCIAVLSDIPLLFIVMTCAHFTPGVRFSLM